MKKILGLLFSASLLWSAPSTSFAYLMNEPISMLDWGIYKTEKLFKGWSAEGISKNEIMTDSYTSVDYDWNNDTLNLNMNFYLSNKINDTRAKNICKKTLMKFREEWVTYLLAPLFHHKGFTRKNKPENLDKEIMDRVYYTISIRTSKTNKAPYEAKMTCEGFYNDNKVMFSK